MAAISFQQNIVRVVHLEVVQGGPLNTLKPNTCLQQPMSGESGLPPRYGERWTSSITDMSHRHNTNDDDELIE